MSKPRPIPISLVCSECGLAWTRHTKKNPRRRDCIELLKREVKSAGSGNWIFPATATYTYTPVTYTPTWDGNFSLVSDLPNDDDPDMRVVAVV